MKVRAIVKCGQQEEEYIIPCGDGQNTFKWLGQVASQRYSQNARTGSLRLRESLRGAMTATSQYQATSITVVETDEKPHPMEILSDYLRGDIPIVYIELGGKVEVNTLTGFPSSTEYSTLAYSLSRQELGIFQDENNFDDDDDDTEAEGHSSRKIPEAELEGDPSRPNTSANLIDASIKSFKKVSEIERTKRINFMSTLFQSQMRSEKKILQTLDNYWPIIVGSLDTASKNLPPHKKIQKIPLNYDEIKKIFVKYWDNLLDLYFFYCNSEEPMPISCPTIPLPSRHINEILSFKNFKKLIFDSEVFPVFQHEHYAKLSYDFSMSIAKENNHTFTFLYFLISLLYMTQLKYNDILDKSNLITENLNFFTEDKERYNEWSRYYTQQQAPIINYTSLLKEQQKTTSLTPVHANLNHLISAHFLTLVAKLHGPSILREIFLSDLNFYLIYEVNSKLQLHFDRISSSIHDVPTTVPLTELTKLLYNCDFWYSSFDQSYSEKLKDIIRAGTIYGNQIDLVDLTEEQKKETLLLSEVDENELTYPEFIMALNFAAFFASQFPLYYQTNNASINSSYQLPNRDELISVNEKLINFQSLSEGQGLGPHIVSLYFKGLYSLMELSSGKKIRVNQVKGRRRNN